MGSVTSCLYPSKQRSSTSPLLLLDCNSQTLMPPQMQWIMTGVGREEGGNAGLPAHWVTSYLSPENGFDGTGAAAWNGPGSRG